MNPYDHYLPTANSFLGYVFRQTAQIQQLSKRDLISEGWQARFQFRAIVSPQFNGLIESVFRYLACSQKGQDRSARTWSIEISGKQKIAHHHLIVANARTIQGSPSSTAAVEGDGFAVTPTANEKAALVSVLSAVGASGIGRSLVDENHIIHEDAPIN
jgi:hypothetical protein